MKNTWKTWLKISKKLSVFLANILLTIIYIILFIPFSFIMQLFFKKSLAGRVDETKKNSYWVQCKKAVQDLAWAQEQ
jgi:hypothetical protein